MTTTTTNTPGTTFGAGKRVLAQGASYNHMGGGDAIPYLIELRELDTRILTRQQEQQLAKDAQAGNHTSREKLIQANLRLVVAIANKWLYQYPQHRGEMTDLIQEGNAALIHAIDKFDPSRNIKLSTYATWWIYQAMQTHMQGVHRPYRVPGNALTHLNTLKRAQADHIDTHGKAPTIPQLASALAWSPQKVMNLMGIQERAISIESGMATHHNDDMAPIQLADPSCPLADVASANQQSAQLAQAFHTALNPKEQDILKRHFGIDIITYTDAGSPQQQRFTTGTTIPEPLHAIGQHYNVSREAIRKAEKRALSKLKKALSA